MKCTKNWFISTKGYTIPASLLLLSYATLGFAQHQPDPYKVWWQLFTLFTGFLGLILTARAIIHLTID